MFNGEFSLRALYLSVTVPRYVMLYQFVLISSVNYHLCIDYCTQTSVSSPVHSGDVSSCKCSVMLAATQHQLCHLYQFYTDRHFDVDFK